jgi:hypothetical protein
MSSLQVTPRNLGSEPNSDPKKGLQGTSALFFYAFLVAFAVILCTVVMCRRRLGWGTRWGPRQIDEILNGPSGNGNVAQGWEVVEMDEVGEIGEKPSIFEPWVLDGNEKENKENKWADIMVRVFSPLQPSE